MSNTNRGRWTMTYWFVLTVTGHLLIVSIGRVRGDDSIGNNTSTAVPVLEFEPALQCENQSVYDIQNFVTLLGGRPGNVRTGSMEGILPVPQNMPVGPSCGNVVPSGHGFWFPMEPETQGHIEMIVCTNTPSATMVPIVYTAPRVNQTTTNCDTLYCVADGITNPLLTTEPIRSEGTICPDASSYTGVRFTSTEDQFYFVYVEVTSEATTELNEFQVTTMVSDLIVSNDHCSSSFQLTPEPQTITTDDFVNVQTDFVPSACDAGNSSSPSAERTWTDEWKGVWYTLPSVENFVDNDENYTQWDLDFCSSTNVDANFHVAIYEGADCESLNCFMEGLSKTCRFTVALPNYDDANQVYHLFVYTDKDPAIGGSVTLKVAPYGMNGGSSTSADFRTWWGMMMSTVFVLLSIWLL